MALRRLAAAESPLRRLRPATFDSLNGAGKVGGFPFSGAREQPVRPFAVSESTLNRIGGCDSTLRRLGAVGRGSWTRKQCEFLLDSPLSARWMSTLPGGGGAKTGSLSSAGGVDKTGSLSSAGGVDKTGPLSSAGGVDKTGSTPSTGGGGDPPGSVPSGGSVEKSGSDGGFDWDNVDWPRIKEYFKIAEVLRSLFKMFSFFAAGLGTVGSAVMFLVYMYVRNEIEKEREKREDFEKKATLAHQEFVFRTNTRYDHLQSQFNELSEKNMKLLQLAYDSRSLAIALMGQLNELQKKFDAQSKASNSCRFKADGDQISSDEGSVKSDCPSDFEPNRNMSSPQQGGVKSDSSSQFEPDPNISSPQQRGLKSDSSSEFEPDPNVSSPQQDPSAK